MTRPTIFIGRLPICSLEYLPQGAGSIGSAVIGLLLQQVILPLPDVQLGYLVDRAPAESCSYMRVDDFFCRLVGAGLLIDLLVLQVGITQGVHGQLAGIARLGLEISLVLEGRLLGLKASLSSFVLLAHIVRIPEPAVPGSPGFILICWHSNTGLS